jgi:hypothetical protein
MSKVVERIACPVCVSEGHDSDGNNLTRFADGAYACAANKDHTKLVAKLRPDLASNHAELKSNRPISHPRTSKTARKPVDLHARILEDFPACVASLADSSPVVCERDEDEARAFLQLYPADAVLWIGKDIYQTGKPEHARCFRTRDEWERESFTAPGMRIAPASFKPGSFSRGADSVAEHLFTVVESDEIGEGKLYADKDEFCALIRWLREACGWYLAAVVDSGHRSLHSWWRHPGATDMELLEKHAAELGLDSKFSEPSQPWRLPGVKREKSEQRQQLLYLAKTKQP